MIKWLRKVFQKGDKSKHTTEEYVSLEYSEDFVDKLNSVVLNAKLFCGSGVYVCGNLTLELKLLGKGSLLFDCIVFDKNYDVVYHLLKESLWVTAYRFPVADYQLYLAKGYLNRDWVYEQHIQRRCMGGK